MMKQFFVILMCGLLLSTPTLAEEIELECQVIKTGGTIAIPHKSPIRPWSVDITNGIISFGHVLTSDYTLVLLDEDGEVAYSTVVPAGTSTVVLPATLAGDFELRLYPDGTAYYYYGDITL